MRAVGPSSRRRVPSPGPAARRSGCRRAPSAAPPRRRPSRPSTSTAGVRSAPIRSAGRCALPRGIETVNVVPWPSARAHGHRAAVQPHELVHQRQADPRALVRARARARARGGSARTGAAARARGCPCRCRRTASSTRSPRRRSVDRDRALERELERVRQQVEDDLLPHVAIDEDGLAAAARTSTTQLEARALDRRRGSALARSLVSAARSVGSYDACARPASMRAKSSRLFTSFSSRSSLR